MQSHGVVHARFKQLDLNDLKKLVIAARKGVKPKVFYDFASVINMSESALAGILNLSARTVSNYAENNRQLQPAQSEHLLKLIALFQLGESVFGSVNEFSHWLAKPGFMTGETPLQWLSTPGGVDLVKADLKRIIEGYPL